jgi:hypothetical protein
MYNSRSPTYIAQPSQSSRQQVQSILNYNTSLRWMEFLCTSTGIKWEANIGIPVSAHELVGRQTVWGWGYSPRDIGSVSLILYTGSQDLCKWHEWVDDVEHQDTVDSGDVGACIRVMDLIASFAVTRLIQASISGYTPDQSVAITRLCT